MLADKCFIVSKHNRSLVTIALLLLVRLYSRLQMPVSDQFIHGCDSLRGSRSDVILIVLLCRVVYVFPDRERNQPIGRRQIHMQIVSPFCF